MIRSHSFEEIVHNHRIVRRFIQDVRRETDPAVIEPLLDQLRGLLAQHFELEELPNGLMDRIKALGPEGVRAAHRLKRQHQQLTQDLEELYAEPVRDETWLDRLRGFADLLAAHEAHEAGFIRRPGGTGSGSA